MSLSAELARSVPRVGLPPPSKKKSLLEMQADAIAEVFGGVARDIPPTRSELSLVERELVRDSDNLGRFARRDLKLMPYIIWGGDARWRSDATFLARYLQSVAERWPGGARRMWRHHVVNFDPASAATVRLANWLQERRETLPERLRALSSKHALLDASSAHRRLASATLAGASPVADFEQIGLSPAVLRGSALMVATLDAVGQALSAGGTMELVPARLTALLSGQIKDVLGEATGSQEARDKALMSLVDGLVAWQERSDPGDREPERTVDFLLALNGDPRFAPGRWRGRVAERSTAAVERWLSRKTIDAFFRVIDALKTDRPDMWKERRAFWMSYLPYVTKAWLVVGPKGVPLADREGMKYARFVGSGALQDHCGLLLQIRETCVMEMNKNGSAIFWQAGRQGLPGLYEETYNRNSIRYKEDSKTVFVEGHHGDWQTKFRGLILRLTSLNVR